MGKSVISRRVSSRPVVSRRTTSKSSVLQRADAKSLSGQVINFSGASAVVPLSEIEPDPNNVRHQADDDKFAELVESVEERGVLQPILLRPIKSSDENRAKYRIIAGERRFRAAKQAKLTEIPACILEIGEGDALDVQLIENIQREDLHPLDEADGLLRLMETENLDVPAVAQRLGKKPRYVARMLALTNLIEDARQDLRVGKITLAHALEICRLAPEVQAEALKACYEDDPIFSHGSRNGASEAGKERLARHVRHLQAWLETHIYLNLKKAPFKKDDSRLREDGLTCIDCPQRTGHNAMLFADIRDEETCLNPGCFKGKIVKLLELKKDEIEKKSGKPAAYLSTDYGSGVKSNGALRKNEYQLLDRKADRCQHAEQAVFVDGSLLGQIKYICREETCKDHRGRVPDFSSYSGGNSRTARPQDRNKRKQELFDIKVDEEVRKRVMKESLNAWSWPLDRADLNQAVKEFFSRIPSEHQRTICEVLGWDREEKGKWRFDEKEVLVKLPSLSDSELAQFLMLCSVAHYGSNHYGSHRMDQSRVVQLARDRGVNHPLIDAQVRYDLCAKKYQADHLAYLEAVKNGKSAKIPVVYERSRNSGQTSVGAGAGKDNG